MFFHIYKRNDKEQRQPEQQPFRSGSVTEVRGKNTKGKVNFLKKFFSKEVSISELEEGKGLLFRDDKFYEVYFLYD